MNRIDKKFKDLKLKKRKAFIAFITAGDPSLKLTLELVLAFEKAGVDIVELGVPFSDPLADGPTIQLSSQRALKHSITLKKILNLVKQIREKSAIPIALMTYYNPIMHYGEKKFMAEVKKAGVDGVIIPDLPPEEANFLRKIARNYGVTTPFFLSPTTAKERVKMIDKVSSGFIYYVSLTGVTGARQNLPQEVVKDIEGIRKRVKNPVCIGFGISKADQVKRMAKISDGVIVGSAIINKIVQNTKKKNLVKNVTSFVSQLMKNLPSTN